VLTRTPVVRITRGITRMNVHSGNSEQAYDACVIATHADTALALLDAPTDDERRVLGAFAYTHHDVVLHGDARLAPPPVASWNVHGARITYSMNRLLGLDDAPYLVTLDPPTRPAGELARIPMAHPRFDRAALAAQRELPRLGDARLRFAGAHFGFGFHEDGMRAGEAAAAGLERDE
jgi:predicted NAD/FAD-binding protein